MGGIRLERVAKVYPNGFRAVDGIDLEIGEGEFMVLVGPSGCGKSTLLRMVAGLEEVSEGTITIGERDVTTLPPRNRDIAMVFQNYALYPHMSVRQNLEFALKLRKVAKDELGKIFAHDIRASGVAFDTQPAAGGAPTARSLILVTPDGERTMNTFLGISPELNHGEVDAELVRSARIVYLEGYLFDRPEAKAAFRQAAELAKKAGRQVALTLSDAFCVDRHRGEFRDLIRNSVDILFANQAEISSLYQTQSFEDASRMARADTKLAVLTRSAQGALILAGERAVSVRAEPVARVVDTTGAGDLYAAGFLRGLSTGRDLETCGRLGSLAAAEIISHIGARPEADLTEVVRLAIGEEVGT